MGIECIPEDVAGDIDNVFCFIQDISYKQRAHEYLERMDVTRIAGDSAVQAVVRDLCRRSYEAGVRESPSKMSSDTRERMVSTAIEMIRMAGGDA